MKILYTLIVCLALGGCMTPQKIAKWAKTLPPGSFQEAGETLKAGPFGGETFLATNSVSDGKGSIAAASVKGSLDVLGVYSLEAHVTGLNVGATVLLSNSEADMIRSLVTQAAQVQAEQILKLKP